MKKHHKIRVGWGVRAMAGTAVAILVLTLGACASPEGQPSSSGSRSSAGNVPKTDFDKTELDKRASVHMELATGYFGRGQMEAALDEIKQALALKPDLAAALNLRPNVYAAMGDMRLAEQSFQDVLSQHPHDPDNLHNYGWFLCQQRRFAQAEVQFDLALAQPEYKGPGRTWLTKGVCEARADQAAAAEKSLLKAFEFDPSSPAVAFNLSQILLRDGQADRALFYIKRVNANNDQRNAQSLWLALRIEKRLSDASAVNELAEQLRKQYPQSPEVAALNNGRFDE